MRQAMKNITMKFARQHGVCVSGIKKYLPEIKLSLRELIDNGIPIESLKKIKHPKAQKLIALIEVEDGR